MVTEDAQGSLSLTYNQCIHPYANVLLETWNTKYSILQPKIQIAASFNYPETSYTLRRKRKKELIFRTIQQSKNRILMKTENQKYKLLKKVLEWRETHNPL